MTGTHPTGPEGNPFQSPIFAGEPVGGEETGQVITPRVVDMLRQTQPWVRFVSVLGFIVCALIALGAIGVVVALALSGGGKARFSAAMVLLYIPMALIYFFPSMYLWRYASRIYDLRRSGGVRELEDALEAQKSFWKFVGILMVIVVVAYPVMIVLFFTVRSTRM